MKDTTAIIAVSFADHVVYSIVENDGEFDLTGEAVISHLRADRNRLVGDIMESQSYESVWSIDDEDVYFGGYLSSKNRNQCIFSDLYRMMYSEVGITEYFYIYDFIREVLLVKTPELFNPVVIDYTNEEDLEHFRHLIA